MPRRGSKRKKTKTHKDDVPDGANIAGEGAAKADTPRSLVVRSNKVDGNIQELIQEIRKIMSPNTASNLRERSYNRLKDYITIAGSLAISHLISLSQTEANIVMKIAKFPNGPTLHLKVLKYCLCKHVRASQKKPYDSPVLYTSAPLVVLHNFNHSDENHMKLLRTTYQHMFPSINIKTVQLNECRRVILFHYNKENDTTEMRHYAIKAAPTGISRTIKKILQAKLPNMSELEDVSEYIDGSVPCGNMSDSEAEDEQAKVSLPDRFTGRGNAKAQQSSMKLIEIGPRITLELFKVERGVCEGEIIYHKYISKSPEEIIKLNARMEREKMLKIQRKKQQEDNVKRKREIEENKKQDRIVKKQKKDELRQQQQQQQQQQQGQGQGQVEVDGAGNDDKDEDDSSDEDDEDDEDDELEEDDENNNDDDDDEEEEEEEEEEEDDDYLNDEYYMKENDNEENNNEEDEDDDKEEEEEED